MTHHLKPAPREVAPRGGDPPPLQAAPAQADHAQFWQRDTSAESDIVEALRRAGEVQSVNFGEAPDSPLDTLWVRIDPNLEKLGIDIGLTSTPADPQSLALCLTVPPERPGDLPVQAALAFGRWETALLIKELSIALRRMNAPAVAARGEASQPRRAG